jgi:hypothetical protein
MPPPRGTTIDALFARDYTLVLVRETCMIKSSSLLAVVLSVVFLSAALASAAGPKTYQVTGPVLEVKDDMIAVQKGKDRWEVGRDASTKVTGDLKVGSKVTIEYKMMGTAVEVKPEKGGAKKK